jgi:hypothetical protein
MMTIRNVEMATWRDAMLPTKNKDKEQGEEMVNEQ